MPQVPTYDSFQVAPQALPDPRVADVQPGNSSLQLGQDLQQAGGELENSAIRLQRQENANAIFQAEAGFKEAYVAQENQWRQRQGQDAWGVATDAANWWQENASKAADGLQNDEQRQIFAKTMEPLKLQMLNGMASFEQQQRKTSVEQSANASIESSIDIAAANPTDSMAITQAKSDILKRLQATAGLNGWTPEISQAAQTEQLTKLHTQVIQSLIDTAPDQAKAYLDANRSEIAGTALPALDRAVEVGDTKSQAQAASDSIIAGSGTMSDALDKAKKYQGEVRAEVETRIRQHFGDLQTEQDRDQKNAADQAWKVMTTGGGYDAIPASLLAQLSGEQIKGLQDEAERRAKGSSVETDWSVYNQLRSQIFENPKKPLDITPYLGSLGESERKGLVDLQSSLMASKTQNDAVTLEKQINDAISQLGFPPRPSTAQKAAIGQLKSQYDQAAQDFQTTKGRKPIDTERQAILDHLMQPGSVAGRFFGTNDSRQFQATAAGQTFTAAPPKEGDRTYSKSGKPVVFTGGKWQYVQ